MITASVHQHDRYSFCHLAVSIDVIRHDGRVVGVKVEAPQDFAKDVSRTFESSSMPSETNENAERERSWRWDQHRIRNRLHAAQMAIEVLQHSPYDGGMGTDSVLEIAVESLGEIEDLVQARYRGQMDDTPRTVL